MKSHLVLSVAVAFCLLIVVAIVGGSHMRKEFPYELEFVPTDKSIGIINTVAWNQRDLVVAWGEKGKDIRANTLMKGSLNQCVLEELTNGKTYQIRIRRADLKGMLLYKPFTTEVTVREQRPKYAILVGASVGKAWNLPSLSERTGTDEFVFGYRGKYGYDKGEVLEQTAKAKIKPDIVIIKECAAYFPKELEPIREKLPQWVDLLASHGITPVLATCAPVTEDNDSQNPGRQEAINEFNQFVRAYAEKNNLGLLDLGKTLTDGEASYYLQDSYAQPDGLHLVPKAYKALDAVMAEVVAADTE